MEGDWALKPRSLVQLPARPPPVASGLTALRLSFLIFVTQSPTMRMRKTRPNYTQSDGGDYCKTEAAKLFFVMMFFFLCKIMGQQGWPMFYDCLNFIDRFRYIEIRLLKKSHFS